jgi:hypothetical protein
MKVFGAILLWTQKGKNARFEDDDRGLTTMVIAAALPAYTFHLVGVFWCTSPWS